MIVRDDARHRATLGRRLEAAEARASASRRRRSRSTASSARRDAPRRVREVRRRRAVLVIRWRARPRLPAAAAAASEVDRFLDRHDGSASNQHDSTSVDGDRSNRSPPVRRARPSAGRRSSRRPLATSCPRPRRHERLSEPARSTCRIPRRRLEFVRSSWPSELNVRGRAGHRRRRGRGCATGRQS